MRVCFKLGSAPQSVGGYGGEADGWSYTSPEFPVAHANELQTFTLPQPVLCVGGALLVQLLGRVQLQQADARYYVCIAHTACRGTPLYGLRLEHGVLEFGADLDGPTHSSEDDSSSSDGD